MVGNQSIFRTQQNDGFGNTQHSLSIENKSHIALFLSIPPTMAGSKKVFTNASCARQLRISSSERSIAFIKLHR